MQEEDSFDQSNIALDVNQKRISMAQSNFSQESLEEIFKLQNIKQWTYLMKTPSEDNLSYPASLETATIEWQSHYLQPDLDFLEAHPNLDKAPSGRPIRRKRVNVLCYNVDDYFASEFGSMIPLYFAIIKTCFIGIVVMGCVFGIYFVKMTLYYCNENKNIQALAKNQDLLCKYANDYYFVAQDQLTIMLTQDGHDDLYFTLSTISYCFMLLMPFVIEIVIRYHQIIYWQYDPYNNIEEDDRALYVKHLPRKLTQSEIIKNILVKGKHEQRLSLSEADIQIEEMVYIYDVHQIDFLNKKRLATFKQLLKVNEQIKEETKEQELNENSTETSAQLNNTQTYNNLFIELMILTKEIELYLDQGLPFTNKVVLKLRTAEQANLIYQLYHQNAGKLAISKINVMLKLHKQQQVQEAHRQSMNLQTQKQALETDISYSAKMKHSQKMAVENSNLSAEDSIDSERNSGPFKKLNSMTNSSKITETALERIKTFRQDEYKQIEEDNLNQDVHIKRGFREDEIFWMNIGTPSLLRFQLRIKTLTITLLMSAACIGIYEVLFSFQNSPERKQELKSGDLPLWERILSIFGQVFVSFLQIVTTVIMIVMTIKSRRSTYSQQENNIVLTMIIIQFLFVQSFPLFMVILQWNGLNQSVAIANLFDLYKTRIIIKVITNVFHLRQNRFYFSRRSLLKKFDPKNYFQFELNQALTPGLFPIRARLVLTFFVYNTACISLYFSPYFLVWCLGPLFFFHFYDRYTILRVFRMDTSYSLMLAAQMIRKVFLCMMPIYVFIYCQVFAPRSYKPENYSTVVEVMETDAYLIFGSVVGCLMWLIYIIWAKDIALFIVQNILRCSKSPEENKNTLAQSYYQSYSKYFESFGIDKLTDVLARIFRQIESKFNKS